MKPLGRPLVKICGVTRPEDAELAVDLGANYLGLNFYAKSPRSLEPAAARRIVDRVRGRVALVGVFVNATPTLVKAIDGALGLDLLQFHGDESDDEVAAWGARAIKAVRTTGEAAELAALSASSSKLAGISGYLFDVRHDSGFGGTGVSWDYSSLAALRLGRPYLVAGGIGPDNAVSALTASGAHGIDVCSGVEIKPGIKDPVRLRRLFEELSHAQDSAAS